MTREEKQLLLKDLSARLPYEPMCEFTDTEDDFCKTTAKLGYSLRDFVTGKIIIKPYLRPMSSMTDEEIDQMWEIYENNSYAEGAAKSTDFLIERHLDCHNLIEKNLALEAPENMYKKD